MKMLSPAIGGVIGGVIGAAIWAAIVHFAHREVGFVAWGVGFLVGMGVRTAAGEDSGAKFGVLAVVIAFLAIVAGKYAGASLITAKFQQELADVTITDKDMINSLAETIVEERKAKGKKVEFPKGVSPENAAKMGLYPPDIMAEATKQWKQLPPDEQQRRIAEEKRQIAAVGELVAGGARDSIFQGSFSLFDVLWFGLAAMTAFRIGSGIVSDD
ncbi:MAG: hypothetical protein ACRC7O_12195 [Fimbriiglobus sp.]